MKYLIGGLFVLSLALVSHVRGEDNTPDPTSCSLNISLEDAPRFIDDNKTLECATFTWIVTANATMSIVLTFLDVTPPDSHTVVIIDSSDVNFVYAFDDPDIKNKFIVTSKQTLRIQRLSYELPLSKKPTFKLQVWSQEFGGRFPINNNISAGPKMTLKPLKNYYYLLIAPQTEQVSVTLDLKATETCSVQLYDGPSNKTELARFGVKDQNYPVFSSGHMMLVVLSNFTENSTFSGTPTGDASHQNTISESSSDVWVLRNPVSSGINTWIIKPSSIIDTDLISLSINVLNIAPKSSLMVYEGLSLHKPKLVLNLNQSLSSQRSLYVKAKSGVRVVYVVPPKSTVNSDDIVVSLSYDVVKACGNSTQPAQSETITSPGYPNQYFFNADCEWNFESKTMKTIHLHFNDFDLSLNDSVILTVDNKSTNFYSSSDDFVATGKTYKLTFNSTTNGLAQIPKRGLSVSIDVNDFGSPVLTPGNISTPKPIPKSSTGTWLIVANRNETEVNNIHVVIKTTPGLTPPLVIYDGSNTSVSKLDYKVNASGIATVVSRINKLIFHYDAGTEKSPVPFNATFEAKDCDVKDRCDNGICMHPEWRCNQIDECGDYSDEKNCVKCEDCGNQQVNLTSKIVTITPNYTKTSGVINCCWFISAPDKQTVMAHFTNLILANPSDLLVVLDGDKKLQTLNSDYNEFKDLLLTTGNKLSVTLFSQNLVHESTFTLEVRAQDIGRKVMIEKEGDVEIPAKQPENRTILFEFEANDNEQVGVNLTLGKDNPDWQIEYYDGFNPTQAPLTVLNSTTKNNPVVSCSNKMLVVAKDFHGASTAKFSYASIPTGFVYINVTSTGSLFLSEVETTPFFWQIKPQVLRKDTRPAMINLDIKKLEMEVKDSLTIWFDDDRSIKVAEFTKSIEDGKSIQVPVKNGIHVQYTPMKKNGTLTFVATYEVVPASVATYNLKTGNKQNITSPSYPNTYPINAIGEWTVEIPKGNVLHVYFEDFDLHPKHPLTIQSNASKEVLSFAGQEVPDDLIFTDSPITFKWNSKTFDENAMLGKGFNIRLEVYGCGGNLTKDTDTIKTPKYPSDVNTTLHCIWIISLANSSKNVPNMINFTVTNNNKDHVSIHDGGSLRSSHLENFTDHSLLSRNSKLLVMYLFDEQTKVPAAKGLEINYKIEACEGKTCEHDGTCIHPDWICNGINNCGDNTDEIYCRYRPEPPTPSPSPGGGGVSKGWLAAGIILGLLFGAILAIVIPILYQKYTGRSLGYQRFGSTEAT